MTYTRSAIGLLTRQYKAVLKKCFLINCGLFALGAVSVTPVYADQTYATLNTAVTDSTTSNKTYTLEVDENVSANLGVLGGTSLTINGGNYNIFGNNKEGISVGSGKTLTIKNIGDAIVTTDESGMFTGLTINSSMRGFKKSAYDENDDFYAAGWGSAVTNKGGTVNVENSVFSYNRNPVGQNLAYAYGGAIYNKGTMSFSGTNIFAYNSACGPSSVGNNGSGGAIHNIGTMNLSDSNTFAYNTASYGGAIYIVSNVNLSGTNTFANNSATSYGGAIYFSGTSNGTISSITGNFIGNSARCGGAIVNNASSYGSSTISSLVGDFVDNYVKISSSSKIYGGAIFNGSTSNTSQYIENARITLAGNTFTGNYIDNNGTITPNSIYNAGIISIADGAMVTINDGYDGLDKALLNVCNYSIFNLN